MDERKAIAQLIRQRFPLSGFIMSNEIADEILAIAPSPQPPDDIKALVEELRRIEEIFRDWGGGWNLEADGCSRAADALERQASRISTLRATLKKIEASADCNNAWRVAYQALRDDGVASPTPPSEGGAK